MKIFRELTSVSTSLPLTSEVMSSLFLGSTRLVEQIPVAIPLHRPVPTLRYESLRRRYVRETLTEVLSNGKHGYLLRELVKRTHTVRDTSLYR